MTPRQSPAMRYAATALMGAFVGGAIVLIFAISAEQKEIEQQQLQRDSLTTQLQVFKQRIDPLREEVKGLHKRIDDQTAQMKRLTAALESNARADAKRGAR